MPSKVYWTTLRCKVDESPLSKLQRLITKAGIEKIDFQNKFIAIKIHFGEPGNMSYLRPNWAKTAPRPGRLVPRRSSSHQRSFTLLYEAQAEMAPGK